MVLAVLRVNPPVASDGLAVPVLFTPVNLRHKGLLTDRDDEVLSALGYNVMVARDIGRFVRSSPSGNTDDIWIVAREVRAQLQSQQDQQSRVGSWAHGFISGVIAMSRGEANTTDEQ